MSTIIRCKPRLGLQSCAQLGLYVHVVLCNGLIVDDDARLVDIVKKDIEMLREHRSQQWTWEELTAAYSWARLPAHLDERRAVHEVQVQL